MLPAASMTLTWVVPRNARVRPETCSRQRATESASRDASDSMECSMRAADVASITAARSPRCCGGAERPGAGVVGAEQVEAESDQGSAGRRGWIGEDVRPAIRERQGLALLDPVAGEVTRFEMAAGRQVRDERRGDLAPVEQVRALDGNRLQGVGEHRVHQPLAPARASRSGALDAREESSATARSRLDDRPHHALQVRLHPAQRDPFGGVPAGRRHELAQRHRREVGVDLSRCLASCPVSPPCPGRYGTPAGRGSKSAISRIELDIVGGATPARGPARRSRRPRGRSPTGTASRNPPPPGEESTGSATKLVASAAMAAS